MKAQTGAADAKPDTLQSSKHVFRILPKHNCALAEQHGPLFFLAGPLTGGDDWQSRMCEALVEVIPTGFTVVIPYGLGDRPPSAKQKPFSAFTLLEPGSQFQRQLPWERHYLDLAAGASQAHATASHGGCILFWLPVESELYPKPTSHGPYAQDTRGELGEWRGRLMHDGSLRVVVGGDESFHGFGTIERNFKHALGDCFKVHRTVEAVAAAAAAFCK